jgi:hypothetical protein
MSNNEHVVQIYDLPDDDERSYWECSCGRSGSAASWRVDIASDKHIVEAGGSRVDRYPAR